jgi:hypothetical protein
VLLSSLILLDQNFKFGTQVFDLSALLVLLLFGQRLTMILLSFKLALLDRVGFWVSHIFVDLFLDLQSDAHGRIIEGDIVICLWHDDRLGLMELIEFFLISDLLLVLRQE